MEKFSRSDVFRLRELAKLQQEIAALPIMTDRAAEWKRHNMLRSGRPMIVVELGTFMADILPPLTCEAEFARDIERTLLLEIINFQKINDDKVVSPYYKLPNLIQIKNFNHVFKVDYAKDHTGRSLGYAEEHPIKDLKRDLPYLQHSVYSVDLTKTAERKALLEETFGDILPIKIINTSLQWHAALSAKIIKLMGMENMLYSMMDYPDEFKQLMNFLCEDVKAYIRWQEEQNLLLANNGNDMVGAGSFGYTDELPTAEALKTGRITSRDQWLNTNSQETIGVSPDMYKEFFYPSIESLAKEFGLVYYGCCEAVHDLWDICLKDLPNLRKISISPWCNEEFMGEKLRGSRVIYSRKPTANYLGVGKFQPDEYRKHILTTIKAAQNCQLEIIHRDVYNLDGDPEKPGKAVKICRKLIEEYWN